MKKVDRREINRRDAERFTLPLKGSAIFKIGGKQYEREIRIRDISAYGAYFLTNIQLNVSVKVRIHLPIEDSDGPFEVAATVVRVEEGSEKGSFGVAVKFDEIPSWV